MLLPGFYFCRGKNKFAKHLAYSVNIWYSKDRNYKVKLTTIIEAHNAAIRIPIPIPKPKFVVLYNGKAPYPQHTEQYLSQSFMVQDEEPVLELKVDVYNINYEENSELLRKSKHLTDYSLFIHLVNEGRAAGKPLAEAIKDAIRYCIEHDIMREFLEENGSEVNNMLLGEWKLEEAMDYIAEKSKKEGEKLGELKNQQEMIRKFSQINTPEQIAEILQLSVDYVLNVLNGPMYVSEPDGPGYNVEKKE